MTTRLSRSILIAGMVLSIAAAAPAARADDAVVAQRGSVTLTASQLRAALANQSPDIRHKLASDPGSLANFVQSILIGRVLLNQATAEKWDQTPEVKAAIERAHDTLVVESYLANQAKPPAGYPSEDEIKTAYQQNLQKLMQPRRYHLQQLMILVPAGASKATDAAARKQAAELRAKAIKPNIDFAAIAGQSTDKAVANAGGDMGWVNEDQLIPAIKSAVAGLPVGGISQPVETNGGWHVLKLLDTMPAGPAPFAQVHDQLAQALRQQKAQQGEQAYLAKMVKIQPVQFNSSAISAVVGNGS